MQTQPNTTSQKNNEGMALILAAFATIVIAGAATLVVSRIHDSKRHSDAVASQLILSESLKGAIDQAIAEVWSLETESDRSLDAYRKRLDERIHDGASIELADGPFAIGAATIDRLSVTRADSLGVTTLTIDAEGSAGGWTRSATQIIEIGGETIPFASTTPDTRPAAFPDTNGNRIVDAFEFQFLARHAKGVIRGGRIHGVSDGRFAADALPTESTLSSIENTHAGNLILIGSAEAPIQFSSDASRDAAYIAIDGDLLIDGYYEGNAQLLVRGNIYVLGDLVASEHSALALAAGGNILLGDYLTRNAIEGKALDMRTDYFHDAAPDTSPTGEASYASAAAMTFNAGELARAIHEAGYVPRFYRMRPGADVWVAPATANNSGIRYDDPTTRKLHDAELDAAAIFDLAPANAWITEGQLRHWWFDDQSARAKTGRPLRIDAALSTANGIFGYARSKSDGIAQGKLIVNGGILAGNTALYGDSETQIHTNPDYSQFARVQDHTKIALRRTAYRIF